MKTLVAWFKESNHSKTYFIRPGDNPEPGDVIITSYNGTHRPPEGEYYDTKNFVRAATVQHVGEGHTIRPQTKPYLTLIKAADLATWHEQAKAIMEHSQRQAEIQEELESLLRTEDKRLRYAALAERNPKARELLAELDKDPFSA